MTRTALLTLGRLPKGLDLARALAAEGWRVVVAEPFGWHLARMSNAVAACRRLTPPAVDPDAYLDDLAAAVEREEADLVLPVSEEILHVAGLHGRIAADRLFCLPRERLLPLADKLRFVRLAEGLGLDVPATAPLHDPEAAAIVAAGDAVVKPVFTCSGRGFRVVRRGGTLPEPGEPAIVQAFVRGEEIATFAVVRAGRVLVNVVYRAAVRSGTVAVAFERIEAPAVERWVAAFAEGTAHDGFLSFDMIVADDGRPFAIECNPRITSGIHFLTPAAIAGAVLRPETPLVEPFRPQRVFQQVFPCLTETQGSLFRRDGRFRANARHLLGARDVTWDLRDPWPLITMTATSGVILARAVREGISLGEAATRDIAWPGRPARAADAPAPGP
jgi:hypothetical protein